MIYINCTSYRSEGKCVHQAAPRRLLGTARCIEWLDHMSRNPDPRYAPVKCVLCTPHPMPRVPGRIQQP